VAEVLVVVEAAGVVEDGEEADDGLVGAGFGRLSRDIHFPAVKGHPVSRTTPGVPFTW
jgi:hypothetical protein